MSQANNMEIRKHLKLVLFVSLTLATFIAAGKVWQSVEAEKDLLSAAATPLATERLVSDWSRNIASTVMRTAVLVKGGGSDAASLSASDATKRTTGFMERVEGLLSTEQEKTLFARIIEIRKAYHDARDAMLTLKGNGQPEEALKTFEEHYLPLSQHYQSAVSEMLQLQRDRLNEEALDAGRSAIPGQIVLLTALAFLAGAGFFWWWKEGMGRVPDGTAAVSRLSRNDEPANASVTDGYSDVRGQVQPVSGRRAGIAHPVDEAGRGKFKSTEQWEEFCDILA